jgi:hypothetical protein
MKHKQFILTAVSALFIALNAAVAFAPTAQAADQELITCEDGKQILVEAGLTREEKEKACQDAGHGGLATADPGPPTPEYTGVDCTDPTEQGNCAKTAFKFGGCDTASTGMKCLISEILLFLSVGVGIAVVAGIAIGGITYATSEGNPSKAQKGITIIVNAVIGLVLYLLLFAITNFLIPGGVFS